MALPLIQWGASPVEDGLHCCFGDPLHAADRGTVWSQTAVAVLILVNKALGSPLISIWGCGDMATHATGMLDNLGSVRGGSGS